MPLRDHLRSGENIDVSGAKSAEDALVIAHVAHRVTIDAPDARVRESAFQLRFQPLGSLSDVMNVFAITFRTSRGRAAGQPAVVTQQLLDRTMIGHRDAAGVALKRESAMTAQEKRRVTAAVEKNHRLLAAIEAGIYRFKQPARKDNLLAFGSIFFPHVHDLDGGQGAALHARRQHHVVVFLGCGVVEGLHRRSR